MQNLEGEAGCVGDWSVCVGMDGKETVDRSHLIAVDVIESVEQLLHHLLDLAEAELDHDIGEQSGQVVFAKVKDQVEGGSVAIVVCGLGAAYLYQIHHIFVFEELQDADLSQGCDWELREGTYGKKGSEKVSSGSNAFLTPSFSFSISTFFMATNLFVVEFFSRALNTSLREKGR